MTFYSKIYGGFLIIILYLTGLVLHFFMPGFVTRSFVNDVFFVTNTIVLLSVFFINRWKRFTLWTVITYTAVFLIEAAGVYSSLIFGNYHYGDVFSFKIPGVPLIIAYNWVVLILGFFTVRVNPGAMQIK